mmetsp:Transcript_29807/g.75042  ORF Transcript_29807/g.75042 Transcript_29807/m.75042 type:complete len:624 (+) Transcript_29807:182-2053(+)
MRGCTVINIAGQQVLLFQAGGRSRPLRPRLVVREILGEAQRQAADQLAGEQLQRALHARQQLGHHRHDLPRHLHGIAARQRSLRHVLQARHQRIEHIADGEQRLLVVVRELDVGRHGREGRQRHRHEHAAQRAERLDALQRRHGRGAAQRHTHRLPKCLPAQRVHSADQLVDDELLRVGALLAEHDLQRLLDGVADDRLLRRKWVRGPPLHTALAGSGAKGRAGSGALSTARRAGGELPKRLDQAVQALHVNVCLVTIEQRVQRFLHARVVVCQEAAREVGHATRDDGVVGVRRQRDALDHGERAHDEGKVWRDDNHVVLALLLEILLQSQDLLSNAGSTDVAHTPAADELPHHLLKDGLDVKVTEVRVALRHKAQRDEVIRDAVPVLQRQVGDVLHQRHTLLLRHLAHEAVVEDGDLAVGRTQQVARVRVRMQEACLEQLDEVGVQDGVAQRQDVVRAALAQLLPRNPRGGEQVARGELGPDVGHDNALKRCHVSLEGHGVVRLQLVVHLLEKAQRPVVQHRRPVTMHKGQAAKHLAVAAQQVDVQRRLLQHTRPLHLDRHLGTAMSLQQAALVHLAQGGRRHGFIVQAAEDGRQRGHIPARQLIRDNLLGNGAGEGRHHVL